MNITSLNWDTQNFGFKVGLYETDQMMRLSLNKLRVEAKKEGFRLVYIKTLEQIDNSSLFFDEKIILAKEVDNLYNTENPNIVNYTSNQIDLEIYDLAIESGKYSRYNLDKEFPSECFHTLYRKWIENSISTDYATGVLIYKKEDIPVGLLTYKNIEDNSTIGLISVNKDYQHLGIGTALIKHYQSILSRSIKTLDVSTQGVNKKAIAFYQKNGYKIKSKTYIYHLWIQ